MKRLKSVRRPKPEPSIYLSIYLVWKATYGIHSTEIEIDDRHGFLTAFWQPPSSGTRMLAIITFRKAQNTFDWLRSRTRVTRRLADSRTTWSIAARGCLVPEWPCWSSSLRKNEKRHSCRPVLWHKSASQLLFAVLDFSWHRVNYDSYTKSIIRAHYAAGSPVRVWPSNVVNAAYTHPTCAKRHIPKIAVYSKASETHVNG